MFPTLNLNKAPAYYSKTKVADMLFWMVIVFNIILIIYSQATPEYLNIAIANMMFAVVGKLLYPKNRVGTMESNASISSLGKVIMPAIITAGIVVVIQWGIGLTFTQLPLSFGGGMIDILFPVTVAISESYLIHWGLQTTLSVLVNPLVGIIVPPFIAVLTHAFVYGSSGMALVIVFASFLVLCTAFEYTKTLEVPMFAHMIINLL